MNKHITTERDKMTFGRMKVNQYAPYAKLDDLVSETVWRNNVVAEQNNGWLDKDLVFGETTYRDLMNSYDKNKKR